MSFWAPALKSPTGNGIPKKISGYVTALLSLTFNNHKLHLNYWLCWSSHLDYLGSSIKITFLKLVSAIFYQFFIFSPYDSPLKTIKNVFYFIQKALFILEIFKFLWFSPFFSTLSRFKRTNGSGIIYGVMNWLA